ncbi:SGNH/GDSL hydrolase family protein [Pigmentiphaga sp. GD03639]|uniref:SGNH/GDSL hydrolase family protein n=2 Tax=Alcaligenaceae TaxID=506 RepID=A0ABP3LXZ0_9BURK|nr:SGNH/GDSL hydrolase family protein [Pigmentiphaga sp. GD03639]MDH2236042.1 SGNH/GDSL hydrolase family protein [Pigmentiphaga sp. GD03639]
MSLSILAGLSLLILGESHLTITGSLIDALHDDLTRQGAKVHSIGACGASAQDWLVQKKVDCGADRVGKGRPVIRGADASTTPISTLIAADKPDVVVIIIGDTMASYDKSAFPKTWAWQSVTSLTKAIADTHTRCVWVGPPWGTPGGKYKKNDARVQLMSRFLATNVAPCDYVDSLKFSKPGEWKTVDGQHFTVAGYKAWGSAITQALANSPALKEAHGK